MSEFGAERLGSDVVISVRDEGITASSRSEAQVRAREASPGPFAEMAESWRPEVVLMDIGLPCIDGYEAARRIRALEGGELVRLVAITGWGQTEDRARSAAAGFDQHMVKPVDIATLSKVLQPAS